MMLCEGFFNHLVANLCLEFSNLSRWRNRAPYPERLEKFMDGGCAVTMSLCR
jgi:hypothetical protein